MLKNDQTFENLINLADFWNDVQNQNVERFSDRVLRRLFVLNYAPNGMWTYFVSVYYMANRDFDGLLNDDRFYSFLNKITAFIWAYAVTNPGVNALRTPIFAEMINIVTGQPVRFSDYLFDTQKLQNAFDNYTFSNNRAITKAMLTWWAFQNSSQELLSLESVLEIEHIYARNRQEKEHSLSNPRNVESLGNKVLLEKRINIRASDYRFSDKVKYYTGFENNRKQKKERLAELLGEKRTVIFYEAPHKLRTTLDDLVNAFGPERSITLCRELTKLHEEIWKTTLGEAQAHYAANEPRGEYVLVMAGAPASTEPEAEMTLEQAAQRALELTGQGFGPTAAAKAAAQGTPYSKSEVYKALLTIQQRDPE